jgi:Ca2+-transporting ATPase
LNMPRISTATFFNWKELTTSIIQGLFITAGTLFTYQYSIYLGFNEAHTRTMVFTALLTSNIFLTLINRSFYYSIFTTLKYKNNMVLLIIGITITLTGLILFVAPLTAFFGFVNLSVIEFITCIGIGFASVIWYELVKIRTRMKSNSDSLNNI